MKSRSLSPRDLRRFLREVPGNWLFTPFNITPKESPQFEIDFWEDIHQRNPDYYEVLVELAEAYAKAKDYKNGLRFDLRLAEIRPENHMVNYNLACSCALTGNMDQALNALKNAVDHGYYDLEHLQTDPDLDCLRDNPEFKKIVETVATNLLRIEKKVD